jgi:uncharacterized membrane protein YfcA
VTWLEAAAVFAAGTAAGTINAVVGAGTLISFPTLLALGYSPVLANVSNTVGLTPGSVSAAVGYRRELAGQRSRLVRLGAASAAGGVSGGVLLLRLPSAAFDAIVPVLIAIGCLLVLAQPYITRWLGSHPVKPHGSTLVWVLVFAAGVYGGYFGAAQGVLLIAILGIGLQETMQRANAAKNVLGAIVNGVAAILFVLVAHVAWAVAALIALGSVLGGQLGARVGRLLPDPLLRIVVVTVGATAILTLRT